MACVVGVRFKPVGKIYYFDPIDLPVAVGQRVIVETARGLEYGEVSVGLRNVPDDEVVLPLKKVVRIGTESDAARVSENKRKEKEAFSTALERIEAHQLEMNLVDVEFTFDGSKIIFYFTAEGRVDFRDLVKDLASVFRTRIEMRQIGVRDEAKLIGGIGPCGRILCCSSFLGEFAPVSIRMAKDQNLSLNPSKISGACGRLMCCLRYEQDTYEEAKKDPTLRPGYVPPVVADLGGEDLSGLEEDGQGGGWKSSVGKLDKYAGRVARALASEEARAAYEAPATTLRSVPAPSGGQPQPGESAPGSGKNKRRRRGKGGSSGGNAPRASAAHPQGNRPQAGLPHQGPQPQGPHSHGAQHQQGGRRPQPSGHAKPGGAQQPQRPHEGGGRQHRAGGESHPHEGGARQHRGGEPQPQERRKFDVLPGGKSEHTGRHRHRGGGRDAQRPEGQRPDGGNPGGNNPGGNNPGAGQPRDNGPRH